MARSFATVVAMTMALISATSVVQDARSEEHLQGKSFTLPKEDELVDVVPWAYEYRKDSPSNPSEAQWLDPTSDTICGYLWEERRPVRRIEVEFPRDAKSIPDSKELRVSIREGFALVQKWEGGVLSPAGEPVVTPSGSTVFTYDCPKDINALKVLSSGAEKSLSKDCSPLVRAFTEKAHWRKPLSLEIEWGFQKEKPDLRWDGRIEAYNGYIGEISPLESGGGVTATGEYCWKDGDRTSARRGIKTQVYLTAAPVNTRTIVTLWTSGGNVSFAPEDLDRGPILIPSVGIYITQEASGLTAAQFQNQLASKQLMTVRQQVRQETEESWASAMKRYHGDKVFPAIPTPPYETPMKIDVPEKQLADQWRLGYWHLKRWSQKMDDKTYCVSIWPFTTISNQSGMTAIGLETSQIIRTLDLMGAPDIAQGGLNYWIFGDHAMPQGQFVDLGAGPLPLANAFNSPNHKVPGYDQHHSGGHGRILEAAGVHCRYAENIAWFQEVKPILEKACDWIILQRKAWNEKVAKNAWCYGLQPPTDLCDGSDVRLSFAINAWYYAGLKNAANILADNDPLGKTELLKETEQFRQAVRNATDRSMALAPVAQVADGTYRRYVPFLPYMRGLGYDIPTGMNVGAGPHSTWFETTMGGMLLIRSGIYDFRESVVQEMLDVYEDKLVKNGQNIQNGYNDAPAIYLLQDDVPMFLRGMYNGYAIEIMPENGYIFRECDTTFFNGGEPDKTFEEAAFLERVRMMLVMEQGDSLWITRATPRAWLAQGQKISVKNAPTHFGSLSYEIVSDVDHGKINATVEMPARNPPKSVMLRFRHPLTAPIKSIIVNGQPWKDFDVAGETIRLHDLQGMVKVEATY